MAELLSLGGISRMKHLAILLLVFSVTSAAAKSVPDTIEHFWMFYGPGGNYGVQQLCQHNDPDKAYTVFAFADHFFSVPFRITTVALPIIAGLLVIAIALMGRRWLRSRHDNAA